MVLSEHLLLGRMHIKRKGSCAKSIFHSVNILSEYADVHDTGADADEEIDRNR